MPRQVPPITLVPHFVQPVQEPLDITHTPPVQVTWHEFPKLAHGAGVVEVVEVVEVVVEVVEVVVVMTWTPQETMQTMGLR